MRTSTRITRRSAALAVVVSAIAVVTASAAGADDGSAAVDGSFTLSVAALSLYVAPFLPILTAALTKSTVAGWIKVALTAALAVVSTAVTTAIATSADLILSWAFLGRVAMAFGVAMASYLVFRKPVVDPVSAATDPKP